MRATLEGAAREAGRVLLRHFRKTNGIRYKAAKEIQNAADLAADRAIAARLRAVRGIPILSEEGRAVRTRTPKGILVVDPLDGTTNFTFGNPIWGVNIAHVREQAVLTGVSHLPTMGDTYVAVRGKGAWRNNKRLHVSDKEDLAESTAILCHGYTDAELRRGARVYATVHPHIRYCRMFGSAAFEMAMVASGGADSFLYSGPKPWDIAPGVLLIEEAGGVVTDERGRAWVPGRPVRILVCSNGRFHDQLLRLAQKAL